MPSPLVGPSPSPLIPTPNLLNLRRGRLLKTMHALLLHVGISEKVSYDLCTLAWLIVVVWHKALWRLTPPHTHHIHRTPLHSTLITHARTPHPAALICLTLHASVRYKWHVRKTASGT